MKLHGYCERCHKVKRVTVRYPTPHGVQIGICDDCANPEQEWKCPVCKQANRNRTGYCTRCRAHTQDRRHR
jgi:hypothetical protein